MLSIDSVYNGLVIDHIPAGRAMDIYNYLDLGRLDCSVAIIKNARSGKLGKKDIIKIEDVTELDLTVLGIFGPAITVNVIKNGLRAAKLHPEPPRLIRGVLRCKNPRCVTTTEHGLEHAFALSDEARRIYRCVYCEQEF